MRRAYRALVEDAFSAILWRFVGAVVNYTRRVVAFASSLYIRACGTRVKRDERPSESENAATLDRLADGVNHRQRRLRPSGARTQCDARYTVSVSFLLALLRACARARAWCVSVFPPTRSLSRPSPFMRKSPRTTYAANLKVF